MEGDPTFVLEALRYGPCRHVPKAKAGANLAAEAFALDFPLPTIRLVAG